MGSACLPFSLNTLIKNKGNILFVLLYFMDIKKKDHKMKLLIISAFPPNQMTAGQDYTRRMILDLIEKHQVFLIYADYPKHTVELPDSVIILKIKPKLRNCFNKILIHPFYKKV